MKRSLFTIPVALIALPLGAARVEIVLDVSGSMRASAGNVSRMEAAVNAVRSTVEAIDANSNVALRLYGHRLPSEPKAASCRDTELVIPFGPLDRQRFISVVQSAKPLGQTPLAFSLEQAAADFGQVGDDAAAVILVSDGEESCGGDPAQVACAFRQRGLELTVHTVGFGVNDIARQQLQAVANCTGGQYRDARNANELADSLRQLTQAGLVIQKQRESTGKPVRGGNGFDSAVPLTPGTYRLDHHQRAAEYDYFTVQLKPGQLIRVTQMAYEVGVEIQGSQVVENQSPTAGVALHGPDRGKIDDKAAIHKGSKAEVGASVSAGQGGTYYVLIGQNVWSSYGIHKDSPFTIELIDVTDAGSGTDAGDSEKDAVKITPGVHKAWLQPGDDKDMYWFDATAGATYSIRARPDSDAHSFRLTVTDEDGVNLADQFAPNPGAAVRVENVRPTRAGRLYVAQANLSTGEPITYALELTASGGSTAGTETAGTAATDESSGETTEKRSFWSWIPGGFYTCIGILLFLLLLIVLAVVAVVMFVRRRKRKP
jgi:hypothetical protein